MNLQFNKLLNKSIDDMSLGQLCDLLAKANIYIYYYENKKWWGRKKHISTAKQVDEWDNLSRKWNEKRSKIKKNIDLLIYELSNKKNTNSKYTKLQTSYKILPISLMIDMLVIENIKSYDQLQKKGGDNNQISSKVKTRELIKLIDKSLDDVIKNGKYESESEIRTF
jgi:hypothetical protein